MNARDVQFHPLPGVSGAEVYSYLRKPHVLSSNSYLVRAPGALAVIDPGGLPEQTEVLAGLVRKELAGKPRPVYILLTHCHLDHCREAIRAGFWQQLPGRKVVIHARGARALREADRRLTQEEILGGGLEPYEADRALFSEATKGDAPFPREYIQLGGGEAFEARPAPGHSPDGVCYRLGGAIFIGDLLAAVTPLIAGVPGWHREDLIASLRAVLARAESGEIRVCYPGHGRPLVGEKIAPAFERALKEAAALDGIEPADAARVRYVSGRARRLFTELGAAFTLVRERLERLAGKLDYLEEWSAAREISEILDSEEVARLLDEFRSFSASFQSGKKVETQVALKAVLIVHRITGLLDYEGLAEVLDPALLRLTRGLLDDYIAEARGFRIDGEGAAADLEELARELAEDMDAGPGAGPGLEDIPDDPEGFTRYLVRTIAHGPRSRGPRIRIVPAPEPVRIPANRARLRDILRILLQELSLSGAKSIQIGVGPARVDPADQDT